MIVALGRLCYLSQIYCSDLSRGGRARVRVRRKMTFGVFLLNLVSITSFVFSSHCFFLNRYCFLWRGRKYVCPKYELENAE